MTTDLNHLSDETLITETTRAAALERKATAELLRLLIEVERCGLHLGLGHSSMFAFCTRTLRLSEHAAYCRITAARTVRSFPQILPLLANGEVTLSTVGLLAPHLTEETVDVMLEAARHKTTRDVERLIAVWDPKPDVPTCIRALPSKSPKIEEASSRLSFPDVDTLPLAPAPSAMPPPAASVQRSPVGIQQRRTVIAPLAPRRYLLKLTIGQETHDKLQSAKTLLRHVIPDGDTEQILNRAIGLLLDQLERTKWARSSTPRGNASRVGKGRHIPAATKREVWRRDGGRCVFKGSEGCCGETAFLEYHHVVPFAAGGATDAANLQLRCRAHNAYEAVTGDGAQVLFDRLRE
jgi:hypothetical protein